MADKRTYMPVTPMIRRVYARIGDDAKRSAMANMPRCDLFSPETPPPEPAQTADDPKRPRRGMTQERV